MNKRREKRNVQKIKLITKIELMQQETLLQDPSKNKLALGIKFAILKDKLKPLKIKRKLLKTTLIRLKKIE